MSEKKKGIRNFGWAFVAFVVLFTGVTFFWTDESPTELAIEREPASAPDLIPPSLATIREASKRVEEAALNEAVVVAARVALPPLLSWLDLEDDVKKRLKERLYSTDFGDKIVPFLINSVELYEPGAKKPMKTFRDFMLPKLADFKGVPGLYHGLFKSEAQEEAEEAKAEKEAEKESKKKGSSSGLKAKKALVRTVLQMYDALYLQTGAHIGKGVPKLSPKQLAVVEAQFKIILKGLASSMKDNKEIYDGIQGMLTDHLKSETMALAVSRFVYEFLERHYQVYVEPIKHERALYAWARPRLDSFFEKNNTELYRLLVWEATKKRFGVQIVVDGLQGHLMEALTGNNPTFLKQIALDHKNKEDLRVKSEKVTELPDQQVTFMDWIAENPKRVNIRGYLPFFKRLYRESKNSIVRNGISTTPTISVRNLPIAMTGIDVVGAKHGTSLPNFHYIDRKGVDRDDKLPRAYYFFGNDAIMLHDITRRAGMRTLFEHANDLGLDSFSCNTPYDRGATIAFDPFLNLALGEKVRDFGELSCLTELFERKTNEIKLQNVRNRLITLMKEYWKQPKAAWSKALGIGDARRYFLRSQINDEFTQYILLSQKGIPAYVQIYNPWPDHFAHFEGPFSDAILSPTGELNRLDHWLSAFQLIYDQTGLTEKTRFGMAGDHGLTPVYNLLNPEVEVFEKFEKETGITLKIKKISSDEGEGPKMNHPNKPDPVKGFDLIIASTAGGDFMVDAFVDQGANWTRQPTLPELRKLKTLGGKTIDLIDIIASRLPESLDYMVVRNSKCNYAQCAMSLIATRDGKQVREVVQRLNHKVFYRPTADLLQIRKYSPYRVISAEEKRRHEELIVKCSDRPDPKNADTWCTSGEWMEIAESTPRPDSVNQIAHLYDSDKAGTINLFPRDGVGYNSKVPGRHAGENFHEKDAFVGFWGGGVKADRRPMSAVNGSISPTIFEWISPVTVAKPGEFGFPVVPGIK